ncbi:phosphopantetheine-binding protein [Paenibacillus solani]|uniref:phosphopantetheine-binding protein n=1 Tax=Paenibacillus solani TaxID=1705565 RepID=UPI003D27BF37
MNTQINAQAITDSVTRIVNQHLQSSTEIKQTDSLKERGMDSIVCMRIIVELENEFNIEIEDEDLLIENYENMNTITELMNRLVAKI